jgi:hypothetical protein
MRPMKRRVTVKHPSSLLTSPESLAFIRSKDKDFQGRVKENKENMDKQKKKKKRSKMIPLAMKKKDVPQPFIEGGEGMVCTFCETAFGDEDVLENEKWWVQCQYCYIWFHRGCIMLAKQCLCGEFIRVQRKASEVSWV